MIEILRIGLESFSHDCNPAWRVIFLRDEIGTFEEIGDHDVEGFVGRGLQLAVCDQIVDLLLDAVGESFHVGGTAGRAGGDDKPADALHSLAQRLVCLPLLAGIELQSAAVSMIMARSVEMVERYPTSGKQRERHEDKFHTHVFLNLSSCLILGEGFGDASLDTLLLTMPISWRGTLAQYVGRLHREHHAKREVIVYDYVESGVSMLARMALKRQSGYRSLGYEIES